MSPVIAARSAASWLRPLPSLRERLVIVLIALLPLHAFLVTVGTTLLLGPGHSPLAWLAVWKEGVIAFVCGIAGMESVSRARCRDSGAPVGVLWDRIDLLILALLAWALLLALALHTPLKQFLFGSKYDFVPLVAFLVLRRVAWSETFQVRLKRLLLVVGMIAAAYGLLTLVLPDAFFLFLGYSPFHSLYVPGGPIAAFQYIGGTAVPRIQGTFSGPNQLGVWLLIPWSVVLLLLLRANVSRSSCTRCSLAALLVASALLLTFSRSAWIAAGSIALVVLARSLPRPRFWRVFLGLTASAVVLCGLLAAIAPQTFLRFASSSEHLKRPLTAVRTIVRWPLGRGIGSAGPASNALSDACAFLRDADDPSWARPHPALCVFLGSRQVQPDPAERECHCPFLPENWYLQIGVELGVVGLVLYALLVVLLLRKLSAFSFQLSAPVFFAFLGVSIAALFLHAWEDSAVAYTVWVLAAAAMSHSRVQSS